MPRLRPLCLALALTLLAACRLALPGADAPVTAPDAIEATVLEDPAAAAPALDAAAAAVAAEPPADPPPAPEAAPEPAPEAASAATAETPAVVEPPKSAAQIACERKRGRWAAVGKSGAKACVRPTGDGDKRCERQSQCNGMCLARSGTCAPMTPLFGCNEILQDDGRRVTLCID